jgi:hypothetical protein
MGAVLKNVTWFGNAEVGSIEAAMLSVSLVTVRPQFADGGDGLQMRSVAEDTLNKQSWSADNGWSSSLGVGRGVNNSSPHKTVCCAVLHTASDFVFFGPTYVGTSGGN